MLASLQRDLHRSQDFYATIALTKEDLVNQEKAATIKSIKQLNHLVTKTEREARQGDLLMTLSHHFEEDYNIRSKMMTASVI